VALVLYKTLVGMTFSSSGGVVHFCQKKMGAAGLVD
jgi:hypothetical protein